MKHTKKLKQKAKPQGDVPIEQAIALLKQEVLEEVRALSSGRIISVYRLTELGAELIKLESEFELTLKAKSDGDKEDEDTEETLGPIEPEATVDSF